MLNKTIKRKFQAFLIEKGFFIEKEMNKPQRDITLRFLAETQDVNFGGKVQIFVA